MSIIKISIFGLFCLFLLLALLGISIHSFLLKAKPEDSVKASEQSPEEIVLFTMPKTGTHLLRPFLEYLTNKKSVSYWSQEIACPKAYLYDKNMIDLLLLLQEV